MENSLEASLRAAGMNKAALARIMKVEKSTVTRWAQRGITADLAVNIEDATNGAVSKSDLRPDLWPTSPAPARIGAGA